jgi:hypothetical protein
VDYRKIVSEYTELFRLGYGHSAEVWNEEGKLVGGIYGVMINGVFTGESIFNHEPNTGKLAFVYLAAYLKQRGLTWFDTQMVSGTTESLGAREIPIGEFYERIEAAQKNPKSFMDEGDSLDQLEERGHDVESFLKWIVEIETAQMQTAQAEKNKVAGLGEESAEVKAQKAALRRKEVEGKKLLLDEEKEGKSSFDLTFFYTLPEAPEQQRMSFRVPASAATFSENFSHWLENHVLVKDAYKVGSGLERRSLGKSWGYDLGRVEDEHALQTAMEDLRNVMNGRFKPMSLGEIEYRSGISLRERWAEWVKKFR